jgi:hypothetical protein
MEIRAQRSQGWKCLGGVIASLVATSAGLLAYPAPAAAHDLSIPHGADVGRVINSHTAVTIEDRECDAQTAVIEFNVTLSAAIWQTTDPTGCGLGGGRATLPSGRRVVRARVCETNGGGCTAWVAA